jgi:hypothetical protein
MGPADFFVFEREKGELVGLSLEQHSLKIVLERVTRGLPQSSRRGITGARRPSRSDVIQIRCHPDVVKTLEIIPFY